MSNIFSSEIKEALKNAQRLSMAGEPALCELVCKKTVEKVSSHNGEDMIRFFYGDAAYKRIKKPEDAVKYIFISKCLIDVYDKIYSKGSASSSAPWARNSTYSNCDIRDFFEWLSKSDRTVNNDKDIKLLKSFHKAIEHYQIEFQMDYRIERLDLVEIIRGLVEGNITIINGVLR